MVEDDLEPWCSDATWHQRYPEIEDQAGVAEEDGVLVKRHGPVRGGAGNLATRKAIARQERNIAVPQRCKDLLQRRLHDQGEHRTVLAGPIEIGQHDVTELEVPARISVEFATLPVGLPYPIGRQGPRPQLCDPIGSETAADDAGLTPNNGLVSGLAYADNAVGRIIAALNAKHLDRSTLVIITAKHGQSPIDFALRQAVDDGPYGATPGLDFFQTDDVALIWLKKSAQAG